MDGAEKRFVYILRSKADPERHYVGIASNPKERLDWHNGGPCGYTVAHVPGPSPFPLSFKANEKRAASSAT